jgi:hypothetical protein
MSARFLAPTRLLARSKLREEPGRRWSLQQGLERFGALGDELLGSIGRELGGDQILRRCDCYVDRVSLRGLKGKAWHMLAQRSLRCLETRGMSCGLILKASKSAGVPSQDFDCLVLSG